MVEGRYDLKTVIKNGSIEKVENHLEHLQACSEFFLPGLLVSIKLKVNINIAVTYSNMHHHTCTCSKDLILGSCLVLDIVLETKDTQTILL